MSQLAVFSGSSNRTITEEICKELQIAPGKINLRKFSDGEIAVKIEENVRGRDIFLIQSTSAPANDHLMELLLIMDALRRASANSISVVMPYYGYGRQDRKVEPRVPISARVVADLIEVQGPTRMITMDLHADQIQGFFKVPVDNLHFNPVLVEYFRNKKIDDLVIVSPDSGGAERARSFGKKVNATLAIIDKRRPKANVSEVMHVIGEIEGKNCILLDDMIDTAGTICKAADALLKNGAKSVYCAASHGVLSGESIDRLNSTPFIEVVLSNSIEIPESKKISKLKTLSVAPLFAAAIQRISTNQSVSDLFN
ncbi:ribose-phosphate diphosphokinase [Leptospira inadai serovar Lyme str. 10]|uniref:Ribose-phosphate pyrophosphokinase n=2 Tax=Leptospira inadai serovar Lyme TaxID=293084 RepID=V6H9Z4_9LEPT|nr:ribose-phosphate pyrophosphokinase [Leptospira inadai]EQA35093.1 ribose-phosphate diphosphokinase [Leptospira inadai serovar Lyme str. 10]PNV73662.1 ribose-phosphate pyrophosphokinase [Leptospira inadai serovar Lyme]